MTEYQRVATLAELPPGTAKTVMVAGRKVALYNVEGQVYATEDACKDQGYSLGSFGTLAGPIVTCGFHYWEYDVRTGLSSDGMDERLETYPVRMDGGAIYVAVGAERTDEPGVGSLEV